MRVVVGFTSLICGLKRASLVTPMCVGCGDCAEVFYSYSGVLHSVSPQRHLRPTTREATGIAAVTLPPPPTATTKSLSRRRSVEARARRVLPHDAYVLSDSQPIRDVLCGSANWACPQWGCGASCCAQCLHSAERSVFSGGAVRAARSAYAGCVLRAEQECGGEAGRGKRRAFSLRLPSPPTRSAELPT